MKKIVLYIFLFAFIVLFYLLYICYNKKEGFFQDINEKEKDHDGKIIILLGDSILDNHLYVSSGISVEDYLKEKTSNKAKIYNFAEDDSTIENVYKQLDLIPQNLNTDNTIIFLSIGGNDIINNYIKHDRNPNDSIILQSLFTKYKTLVNFIQEKMNKSKIFLLDIYYPKNVLFQKYIPILHQWNSLLETNMIDYSIIPISKYVTEHKDFTYNIEPSKSGGEKIANVLMQYL
jgi:lysophospholipase L1-like esterase